jgi:hypothetical protein
MGKIKKQLIKLLINRRIKIASNHYLKKMDKIEPDKSFVLDPEIIKMHKQKWSRIIRGKIDLRSLKWYSGFTKNNNQDFVPEYIYYTIIEPILNDQTFSLSYSDKNFYDLIYPIGLFPETILRNIEGVYSNNLYSPFMITNNAQLFDVLSGNDMIVIKPSLDSGGGKDVELFLFKDENFITKAGVTLTFQYLQENYKQNFVIQKYLHQHPFLKKFNNTSLNTIRVLTYRSPITNCVTILHCLLRIGAKNNHVDNFNAGGYAIGINSKGVLNNFAINNHYKKVNNVNEIDLSDNQLVIPFFDKVQIISKEIAKRNIHHKLLGLDITIDSLNNIRCVEVNNDSNGMNFFQLVNGTLFGEFTDEVIQYCESNIDKLYKKYDVFS